MLHVVTAIENMCPRRESITGQNNLFYGRKLVKHLKMHGATDGILWNSGLYSVYTSTYDWLIDSDTKFEIFIDYPLPATVN